ncbi:MAG: DUF1549 and DUF1553 domain-containing protein, partial [Gemmataceae bacterium]|nr:DUF1549 and DUF1553 domain-containing protein [Gemmataceae bacterium]
WASNPIDAFLQAKTPLTPAAEAPPRTLLRRLHRALTGLPPSPEEADRFAADPASYPRVVENLLASPAFGERFGRLWLDLARYADTNGYERDGNKPFAWRYRDWVVDALNADLPYDDFVKHQIAGDEVAGSDARSQIATTFLRLGTWDDEPANESVDRYDQLDDVLGTVGSVFLGQTIRCARCHDHKSEPFSQRDYYRLLAVFEPLKRPQNGRDDLTYPVGAPDEMKAYRAALAGRDAALQRLSRLERSLKERIRQRHLRDKTKAPAFLKTPPRTLPQWLLLADRSETAAFGALGRRKKAATAQKLPDLTPAYVWHEAGPVAPATQLLKRGNPNLGGPEVAPGFPSILGAKEPPIRPQEHSTGRRLWLAEWIASRDNPLTARVIVNRLWQWHFGRGLVGTPSDFGLMGERPTHPELLDWLACELIESGWSLKHLHRLILHSSAYRAGSAHDGPDSAAKLAGFLRWRQRRLEAESVRDGMLSVSGSLSRRMHGPGVYPELPAAVLATQSRPGSGWGKSPAEEASRRSIYVFAKRTLQLPELELLDAADTNESCAARPGSTTAPQALTFLNGAFAHEQARRLAARVAKDRDPVRSAYRLVLSREPTEREAGLAKAFLAAQAAEAGSARALASFCLV